MAERYVAALGVLDELVAGDGSVPPDARSRLSELQGMANRILRHDQADWVDVHGLLGSPDRNRLSLLRDLAASTNRALKENAVDGGTLRDDLARSGWADDLTEARATLRARLAVAAVEPNTVAAPASAAHQPDQKETDPMPTVEEAPAPATTTTPTTKEGFLRALEDSATADRTCKKHEAVRYALKSDLLWADIQPSESPVIDVSHLTDRGLVVYEVLGAGRSTYQDLRSGATRLLEINHTLPTPAHRLHLVLCQPPAEDWSADTVRDVFNVHVLWRTPDGWGGEDTETAWGSYEQ
jgi:hypothetical protein